MNCVDPGQMASADLDLHLKRLIGICQSYLHSAFIRPNTVFVQLVQQRKGEKPDLVWICFNNYYSATGLQGKWNGKATIEFNLVLDMTEPSELDWLQVYDMTHWWKIVLRTGASLVGMLLCL